MFSPPRMMRSLIRPVMLHEAHLRRCWLHRPCAASRPRRSPRGWRRGCCSTPSSRCSRGRRARRARRWRARCPIAGSMIFTSISGSTTPTVWERCADRGIPRCHRDARRRFRQPVGNRDLRQVHLGHHAAHQRLGTERAGHDAGAQRGQIEARKLRDARARRGTSSARRTAPCTAPARSSRARAAGSNASIGQRQAP